LEACKKMAVQMAVNRIKFYSPWPVDETSAVLSAADCLLLPTQGRQSLTSVPSKMISYLFAAKPIVSLSLSHSETARTIEKACCGLVLPPANPKQLADALIELCALPHNIRDRMGQSGKRFAVTHFSSDICLPRIRAILEASV
jgi:glycosyltransferase involved in cell wall biosynthesis